jgi:hypothetical protein
MALPQKRLIKQNVYSFLKKKNNPVWIVYNSSLFPEECNSPCSEELSIFVEAPLGCYPQNTAMHSNVEWPHCIYYSLSHVRW